MTAVPPGEELDPAPFNEPAELVIAGGRDRDEASAVLAKVRGALVWCGRDLPVLYVGNGISRPQALDEGASEFLAQPAYVRDAVTIARLLAGRKKDNPSVLAGDLGEHFGFYFLVRAISAIRRNGVLTLVRGMRRGEVRFYEGEVTSAQAGLLHGLAAFHQLLLWTEGRFELRPENVVRRGQIPLQPDELFSDSEKFLAEMSAVAGQLSPPAIYERDEDQIGRLSGAIPDPVDAVLRLFDGSRTVADVVEDCTFRVFETLRLGNRLCELGLIRLREGARPRHKANAALAIEEWLGGQKSPPPRQAAAAPRHVVVRKSEPIGPPPGQPASPPGMAQEDGGRRKKKRRGGRPPERHAVVAVPRIEPLVVDWVGLLPQPISPQADVGVSQVVPSSVAAGEINPAPDQVVVDEKWARRAEPPPVPPLRERIEEVAPAAELVQLFTSDAPTPPAVSGSATGAPLGPPPAELPRVVIGGGAAVDEEASTQPLEKVDLIEVEDSRPHMAAGEINVAAGPEPSAAAVPSVVVDSPSTPSILLAPPPVADPVPPPIPEPIAVVAEAKPVSVTARLSGKKSSGPQHPRKPTPPPVGGKRKKTVPPIATFSDAEEAFFAAGSKLAESDEPEAESFEDLDEGLNLPQTFWKRLFRSPTTSIDPNHRGARRPGPRTKK